MKAWNVKVNGANYGVSYGASEQAAIADARQRYDLDSYSTWAKFEVTVTAR